HIIQQHITEMLYGNITTGISSWWGQGTPTDQRFSTLLQAARGTAFTWSVYYEVSSKDTLTADQIHSDLIYLHDHYAGDANYLKIDGRFVVFVYNNQGTGCAVPDLWSQANKGIGAYIVLKVLPNYRSCPNQPDGWHQYAPARNSDTQGDYSITISPGFWKKGEQPRLTRDINQWAADVRAMVSSKAAFQLITSFNEWGEGTAIEPATTWQTPSGYGAFLDVLHNNGIGQLAQLGSIESQASMQPQAQSSQSPTAIPLPGGTKPTGVPQAAVVLPTLMPSLLPQGATGDPILMAAGDISTCSNPGDFSTAKIIEQYPNAVVASLGDTVYEQGSPTQFAQCFDPSWGKFKDRIHPAVGNHEYLTHAADGYFGYFGAAAGDPAKGYYSYDVGAWHIVVINSNCGKVGGCNFSSPQGTWLKADLAAHPAQCTLAYWHHPRWSSGEHGSQQFMSDIWTELYDGGVDVVLSGHDHDYERFAPLDPSGNIDQAKGIREFVVGTGGKNYYPFNGTFIPGSEVHQDNVFGVLKLTLHAASYDWQFLPEPGKAFTDSGTGQCH
ncbi:MAG: metallophosphoesterase, partial [Anaerolineaceae bacterium]|nr:metallophosphoesterase [Anaerolineaceae bacterium]